MQEALRSNTTNHPVLINIITAEEINRRNYGALVAPWNLNEVPEDYLMAYHALRNVDMQKQNKSHVDRMFKDFQRKNHYRNY